MFYEYIEGRDLTKEKETLKTFEEIGKICAHINKVKVNGHISTLFNRQLRELHTGAFKFTKKEAERRRRNNIKHVKLKPVFNERKYKDIKGVYNKLKKKLNPELTLEANDVAKGNFRLGKDNKVYFVDIEAIKPKVKGFGIGKLYLRWAKEKKQQQAFAKGYTSVSSLKFFTVEYKDFIYISFLIQRINYGIKIHNRDFFEKELVLLDKILEKYTVQ